MTGHTFINSSRGFGELLKRYRLNAGLTQEELAERADLSVRGVSDLERGVRTRPYKRTLRQIVAALALTGTQAEQLGRVARGRPSEARAGALSAPPSLPVALTPLVGRDEAVAQACALLRREDVRLVTVTGPPGVGKTRFALEV